MNIAGRGGERPVESGPCTVFVSAPHMTAQVVQAVPGCQGAELWDGEHRMLWKSPLEPLVAASMQGGDRLQAQRE